MTGRSADGDVRGRAGAPLRSTVLVLVCAAFGVAVLVAASPGRASSTAVSKLQAEMNALVQMPSGPPGAIAIVQRGGRQIVFSAGVAELGTSTPVTAVDHMRIASTSKAFSGAVALALVAQHRLSLDDTIARLLPSLPKAWGGVTLRELLDHTSGLEDFSEDPAFLDYLVKNLHAAPSPKFILHFIAGTKPRFTPGTAYRYSNTDNFVIALMAEAATHRSYTHLLARYLLRPLGLGGTSLPSSFAMPAPYLHGYDLDPPPADDVSELVSAAYAWASGGIVSTPADLSTFIRAYAGGRLFSRAVRAAQLQFVTGNSEPIGPGTNSAGLGIFRYRTPCGTVYGHTGNTSGYTQFMAASPDGRASVTVSISDQATNKSKSEALRTVFARLRTLESDAVCLALR